MGAAVDEDFNELQVPPEARHDRLVRRVAALERQVEARIAQVEDLQRRLAHVENAARAARLRGEESQQVLWKANEYDALMSTLTMKALRLPRSWYGRARRIASRVGGR